ncbi:MAG: capsule assembly Wzi family protein [bacterium]
MRIKKIIPVFGVFLLFCLVVPEHPRAASLKVPVGDWKYEAVERIALAWGIAYPLNSRPMNRLDMARIVSQARALQDANTEKRSDHLEGLLSLLEEDLGLAAEDRERPGHETGIRTYTGITLEGAFAHGPVIEENNAGDTLGDGWHGRVIPEWGFETSALAGALAPRLWLDGHDDETADVLRLYLAVEGERIGIAGGRDSLWWGPGRHGAWVLTNNAPPLDLVRLYNPYPYSLGFLGTFRFALLYGRTSAMPVRYRESGAEVTVFTKPHFGGMRIDFSPSPRFEFGASMAAHFIGRDGLSLDDVKEVFFPRHKAVNREETEGPVTDRVASFDASLNLSLPFRRLRGMRAYVEYGGTDLSFVDRFYPRLTDVATLYGLYIDTGATDLRVEYAQNLDHDDTRWYTHGQFLDGYTHDGSIIGHAMGGAARDVWVRMTHPFGVRWRVSVDYEHLLRKERYGSIPGRQNGIRFGLRHVGAHVQAGIEYEYERGEWQGIGEEGHLLLVCWTRRL